MDITEPAGKLPKLGFHIDIVQAFVDAMSNEQRNALRASSGRIPLMPQLSEYERDLFALSKQFVKGWEVGLITDAWKVINDYWDKSSVSWMTSSESSGTLKQLSRDDNLDAAAPTR